MIEPPGEDLLGALAASLHEPLPAAWPARDEDEALLASCGALYGAPARCLIAVDPEGLASCIAGSLPGGPAGPRLLDALESSGTWTKASAGEALALEGEALALDAEAVLRLLRQDGRPLGAVLLERAPLQGPSSNPLAADRLLGLACRAWLLSRKTRTLRGLAGALIAGVDDGVLLLDGQGRVIFLSERGGEILGIDPAQAKGADCTRILRPTVGEKHPLLAALDGELERIEIFVNDGRGRDLPLALRTVPLPSEGQPDGLLCLFRDLTEERAFDLDAQRRERLAAIGELAAGVAHEIRNPLTAIANCAQVLQMRLSEPESESNRKMADLIYKETQRLDRIVTSLLGFARPGPPRMSETRIEEIVRAALELQGPACAAQDVRHELRVLGRIPPIFADPEQVQQVLLNLLRNALQAMPDGGMLKLEVLVVRRRTHRRRGMGRRASDRMRVPEDAPLERFVRVRVQDTGAGIPEKALTRIFDPFFTTRAEGTGLGLSISQSMIREHGGFISVQSVQGKGTTFDVDLPVERRSRERRSESRR